MNAFERFVTDVIDARYRTASALADDIGMSVSALLRGVEAGSLGVDKLLRLAEVAGAHPSQVLRLAGKADTADLIERLYHADGKPVLTSIDRALLALPHPVKRRMLDFVRAVSADKGA